MVTKRTTDTDQIVRLSFMKAVKIALFFLVVGVFWILISDNLTFKFFSNLHDAAYFSTVKGLVYVFLSAIFILSIAYFNIKRIFQSNATERQDKQLIEKQRSLLKALLNSSSDLIFYKNAENRYIGCNRAFEEFVGLTETEIIGKTDYDLFDSKTADLFRQMDLEMIHSGISKKNEELVTYPDGHTVWLETNKSPFYDSSDSLVGLIGVSRDITEIKSLILQLEKEKTLFETFINSSQDFVFLKDDSFRHLLANRALADFYGKEINDLVGKSDYELMDSAHADSCRDTDQKAVSRNMTLSSIERVNDKVFETRKFPVSIDQNKTGVGGIIRDITTEYRQQETINRISETNRIIAQCMMKPFADIQEQLDYALHEALNITGSQYGYIYLFDEATKEFSLNSWTKGVMGDCAILEKQTKYHLDKTGIWGEVVRQRRPIIINDFDTPNPLKKGYPTGHVCIRKFMSLPIFENDKIVAVIGFANKESDYSYNDIQAMTLLMSGVWIATKKKEKEEETEDMAYHDYLTGLYNRRFFEEEFMRRNSEDSGGYPIAIIMGDVNGLKMYNDTFGHLEGDKALKDIVSRIKNHADKEDIIARLGGDEFAIIRCNTTKEEMDGYLDHIDKHVNYDEEKPEKEQLTISFGYSIQRKKEDSLDDLMKEAEAFMYNRKYYSSRSTRSTTVNVIMEALFTKSEREKKHSERVGLICKGIAEKMHLGRRIIDRVKVVGFLHDIGKIGISEEILNKDGKLDANEWEIMKLHPAKGARILENTVEFYDIADVVLFHHERFDGSGYPKGLKGAEIPLMSRIMAVADAYDAMTNTRSYRKAMSPEDAVNELRKYAGSQFDPEIVSVFVGSLEEVESLIRNV